jgi:5-hydroxyisourate hydrolase-like protein (transthyretin family)
MTSSRKLQLIALMLLIVASTFALAGDKKEEQVAELRFLVVKKSNGKPVANASVVLHPVGKNGKQEKGGLQLKTNEDGKTSVTDIPYGKMRVQVIYPGYQTFGDDYVIDKATMEITIQINRPTDQYSIYK